MSALVSLILCESINFLYARADSLSMSTGGGLLSASFALELELVVVPVAETTPAFTRASKRLERDPGFVEVLGTEVSGSLTPSSALAAY
jgi:hypothetical protein